MPARRGPVHHTTRLGLRAEAEERRSGLTEQERRYSSKITPYSRTLLYKKIDDTRKRTSVAAHVRKARNNG